MRIIISCFLISIIFFACDQTKHFDVFETIENSKWDKNTVLSFVTEIENTEAEYNLLINVRNSGDYPYSNLYLFVNTTLPDGSIQQDTAHCILADPSGKWTGRGLAGIWANQIMFKNNFKFPVPGTYKFDLMHAMRDNPLPGIKDAGLRLERAQ